MSDMFCKLLKSEAEAVEKEILKAETIGIIGHIRPDGDDVGSCLGLWNYIRILWPRKKVTVLLEEFPAEFGFLPGAAEVCHDFSRDVKFDLCFMMDCADLKRMGEAGKYFLEAGSRICIDHHATNDFTFEGLSIVDPAISSTCELVCSLIDMNKLDGPSAECLYMGIAHDTGVFKYNSTTMQTMTFAGKLINLGARVNYVIDNTFFIKRFEQNRATGRALLDATLELDGKVIVSHFTLEEMKEYDIAPAELDGCIAQLRQTRGVEAAAFVYQLSNGSFKASLRSNEYVDVSAIAKKYGGGGHVRAAGFELEKPYEEVIAVILEELKKQL